MSRRKCEYSRNEDRLWECGNLELAARFPSPCGNRSVVSTGTTFPQSLSRSAARDRSERLRVVASGHLFNPMMTGATALGPRWPAILVRHLAARCLTRRGPWPGRNGPHGGTPTTAVQRAGWAAPDVAPAHAGAAASPAHVHVRRAVAPLQRGGQVPITPSGRSLGRHGLAARRESPAAFDGRCIPPGCVAPRSHTAGMLPRHALPDGRITCLGATLDFHDGLLGALAGSNSPRRRSAPLTPPPDLPATVH